MITFKKIATTGQGDEYKTECLLDYPYFKKNYNLNTIDLSKQQKLDANPKAMQQINYTGNLNRAVDAKIFFITEETKETVLDFSKETVKVSWFQFVLL